MFPGNRGFVGGTTDQATGLVNLSARQYDPVKGQFVSPDPVLKPYDPQDLNPYGYGLDNPSTNADPTGTDPCQYTTGCGGVGSAGTSEGAGSNGGGGGGGGQCGGSCYPGEFTGSGSSAPAVGPVNYGDNAYYGGGVNLAEQLGWKPKPLPGPPPVHHNTASTGQGKNYCATGVAAARFGVGQTPGCVPPPAPKGGGGFNPFASLGHLIAKHWQVIAGAAEIVLGVASMLTPAGWIAETAFWAAMALSAATTANSCAHGAVGECTMGAMSMAFGGAGYALGRWASTLQYAAAQARVMRSQVGFFRGLPLAFRAMRLSAGAFVVRSFSQIYNGVSVVTSGLSDVPENSYCRSGGAC
jgi:RHS repeat-associated protein